MSRFRVPLEIFGVVVALLFGYQWYTEIGRRAVAEADQQLAQHQLDSIAKIAPRIDTIYAHDTLRLSHTVTVYTQVRDTLLLNIHDTVEVVRFVHAADSTIAACQETVRGCNIRHSVDSAQTALWKRLYNDEHAKRPSFLTHVRDLGLALGAGYLLRTVTTK